MKARQNVKMQVPDGLSAVRSGVIEDLKAIYPEFLLVKLTNLVHQFCHVLKYRNGNIKDVHMVSFRDHNGVVCRDWVVIQKCKAGITLKHKRRRQLFFSYGTKNTGFHC